MILKTECPTCHKPAKEKSSYKLGARTYKVYECGHIESFNGSIAQKHEVPKFDLIVPEPTKEELYDNLDRWVSEGGAIKPLTDAEIKAQEDFMSYYSCDLTMRGRPYQVEGVDFAEKGNLRVLFADEMSVGKTIQALLAVKRNQKDTLPFLALVPQSIIIQWLNQYHAWISPYPFDVLPILDRQVILPGAKGYIMSRDLLSRKGILEKIATLGIKLLIVDECQAFKDESSKRTQALIDCIRNNKIPHLLFLSGTPIKNFADEYFPILNLLDPARFHSRASYRREFLQQNEQGKWTKIRPEKQDDFFKITSKYIIRRLKRDVLPDLPPLTRDWQFVEITDPSLKNSYNETISLFGNFLRNTPKIQTSQILGWLAKLRAITGLAKCQIAFDWISDFLDSSDEKLAVGIHHNDVRDTLYHAFKAKGIEVLKLSGEDNAIQKYNIVQKFRQPNHRLLILQSLSGGVGLDGLQICPNLLTLEREWNATDEEQLESRFDRDGQKIGVTATYMMAIGTIDEFFHKMVYEKSHNTASAGIGEARDITSSLGFLKEFAEFVVNHTI